MTQEAAKNTEQLSALPGEVTKQDFVTLMLSFGAFLMQLSEK